MFREIFPKTAGVETKTTGVKYKPLEYIFFLKNHWSRLQWFQWKPLEFENTVKDAQCAELERQLVYLKNLDAPRETPTNPSR